MAMRAEARVSFIRFIKEDLAMAYHCERCGKGIMHGHNVSHAKNRTNRLFRPNLQTLRVPDAGGIKHKTTLCSECVRIVRKEMVKVVKKTEETSSKQETVNG